jgi:hypothetical protein
MILEIIAAILLGFLALAWAFGMLVLASIIFGIRGV